MTDYIENGYAKYWIEKDILFIVYKKGISLDRSAAIKVVEDRLAIQQGRAFLIFCDVRGIKSANKDARSYFAVEGSVLIKAVAFLSNSPLDNTLSDFFIKINNPTITPKLFSKKEDAIEFLNNSCYV
ncbi:hypothetical protein [Flavivirga sp. 57AJ16]|uniref:DUF7793 family protein n=1 Tax=Flavivirga sp. 57AJ16 TaxID=3025307 RepID=UPI002366EFB4|nr:hypothetical protein [Flavivirga sp. 57AJ16]MDD7888264.1 hypothetical protein [Flavivirga sp. 57AJ16]